MDFFAWQGARGVNCGVYSRRTQRRQTEKDAISCRVMGEDWYYIRDKHCNRRKGDMTELPGSVENLAVPERSRARTEARVNVRHHNHFISLTVTDSRISWKTNPAKQRQARCHDRNRGPEWRYRPVLA
jgi:hypothetical protein